MPSAPRTGETASGSLELALMQLERRADNAASGWRLLLYVFVFIPLALVACTVLGFGIDASQLWTAIALSVFLALIAVWYSASLSRELRRRLATSRLAMEIAAGDLPPEPLVAAVPWLWRGTVPRGKSLADTLRRLAGNLDWYLGSEERRRAGLPSRRLFRTSWLVIPLCLFLWLGMLWPTMDVLWTLRKIAIHLGGWRLAYMLLSPLLPLLPLPFIYYRRQVWTQELIRYLRSEMDDESG